MRWPEALLAALSLALTACGCATSPDDDLLPGRCGEWRLAGPVREFTAANLHEQIDGAAPFVISFGFRSLAAADYRCGDGPATGVEVYDMGSIDNAFALFRSNASVEATPIEVGTEGVFEIPISYSDVYDWTRKHSGDPKSMRPFDFSLKR